MNNTLLEPYPPSVAAYHAASLEELCLSRGIVKSHESYALLFGELKKYLWLCSCSSAPLAMLNEAVDAVWHQFILCTRDYRAFCEELGSFVDHRPNTSLTPTTRESAIAFRRAYSDAFGAIPAIWQLPDMSDLPIAYGDRLAGENCGGTDCGGNCDNT